MKICIMSNNSFFKKSLGVFQQPLGSPVLAPSYDHLFGPLHELMGGQKFEWNE